MTWLPHPQWDDSEGLLTGAEVAAAYSVDVKTVSRWARNRQIPAIMTPGRQWRFSRAWVRKDLARGK